MAILEQTPTTKRCLWWHLLRQQEGNQCGHANNTEQMGKDLLAQEDISVVVVLLGRIRKSLISSIADESRYMHNIGQRIKEIHLEQTLGDGNKDSCLHVPGVLQCRQQPREETKEAKFQNMCKSLSISRQNQAQKSQSGARSRHESFQRKDSAKTEWTATSSSGGSWLSGEEEEDWIVACGGLRGGSKPDLSSSKNGDRHLERSTKQSIKVRATKHCEEPFPVIEWESDDGDDEAHRWPELTTAIRSKGNRGCQSMHERVKHVYFPTSLEKKAMLRMQHFSPSSTSKWDRPNRSATPQSLKRSKSFSSSLCLIGIC